MALPAVHKERPPTPESASNFLSNKPDTEERARAVEEVETAEA